MTTMFVRHRVADFAAWRRAYDEFDPTRRSMGVTGHAVFRSADEPNDVTVTHEFATAETAHRFVASDELRNAMQRAGVASEPTIWFAERV
jgi:heme-degrading monooxygenase HmoA